MFLWTGRFVTLVSPYGGLKICKIGFSWTTLFLWWFVPLFRGDWISFIVYMLLMYLTRGISILIFPIFYNRLYIMGLLNKDWRPASFADWEMLRLCRFKVPEWDRQWQRENQSARQETKLYQEAESYQEPELYQEEVDWEEEREQAVDVEWHDNEE